MEQEPQRGLTWPLPRNRGRITFAGAEDRGETSFAWESNPSVNSGRAPSAAAGDSATGQGPS